MCRMPGKGLTKIAFGVGKQHVGAQAAQVVLADLAVIVSPRLVLPLCQRLVALLAHQLHV